MTASTARNATTNPLMMRPAQRPFLETGAACVSDGMNLFSLSRLIENQPKMIVGREFVKAIRCAGPPKRETVVSDDRDACTSRSPTPPALAAQKSYADAWCSLSVTLQRTGQPIRATSPVPFLGRVHPALQDPSSSANSGASVGRSQAPLASPSVR